MATITIDIDIQHLTGKFISKDDLVSEIESAIGGSVFFDDSEYEVNSVSVHECREQIEKRQRRIAKQAKKADAFKALHETVKATGGGVFFSAAGLPPVPATITTTPDKVTVKVAQQNDDRYDHAHPRHRELMLSEPCATAKRAPAVCACGHPLNEHRVVTGECGMAKCTCPTFITPEEAGITPVEK
jgi:hypothetical protein